MSQYGANGYAKNGYDYKQILKHYYTNIEIYTFLADDIYLVRKSFTLDICIISFIVVSLLLRCINPFSKVASVINTVKRILISSYLRKTSS